MFQMNLGLRRTWVTKIWHAFYCFHNFFVTFKHVYKYCLLLVVLIIVFHLFFPQEPWISFALIVSA